MKNLIRSFPRVTCFFALSLAILAGVEYHSVIASWFTLQSLASALLFTPLLGATTSIPSTCQAVTNSLLIESGRYGPQIFARAARTRPIIRLQQRGRGAYSNGMGLSIGAVTFERSLPDTLDGVWANVALSDGDTNNACLPPADTAGFGQTARTYQPQHMAINTDYFCIRDIQFDFQYAAMLAKITSAFGNISEWVWASRYTAEYVRLAGHHLTLNKTHGEQDDGTSWSGSTIQYNTTNPPDARPSQAMLNDIYMMLYREGADLASGLDDATGEPVFDLILGSEMSRNIIKSDPSIATDNRYAFMGSKTDTNSPLLVGMPTKRRNYGGFFHNIDPYPRRFVLTGGVYVQVAPFVKSSTTKGNKWEFNPAYKAATYEEIIVWHQNNYTSEAVNTVTDPAPGWKFDQHSWMGAFEPRNILHRTCNPDGTMIFWRALFADASHPENPAVGYSILALNCPGNIGLAGCDGNYSTYPF
jgi:hypothetical protein